ncbi:MAG: tRNA (adenosine(37)-N6)-threonylcarbamoyltransferase complex ATPase subunit type 1 TsaE [Deltaproteobacteria bacterium]
MGTICNVLTTTPDETAALAARLAERVQIGDTLLLSGPIGAGKSVFARSLIQSLLTRTGQNEDVPSPTFTLVQRYQAGNLPIVHADLYRLKNRHELDDIGLLDDIGTALTLIEWPELLPEWIRGEALSLTIAGDGQQRHISLSGAHSWAQRLSGFGDAA